MQWLSYFNTKNAFRNRGAPSAGSVCVCVCVRVCVCVFVRNLG